MSARITLGLPVHFPTSISRWLLAFLAGLSSPSYAITSQPHCDPSRELSPDQILSEVQRTYSESGQLAASLIGRSFCMEIELPQVPTNAPQHSRSHGWSRDRNGFNFVSYQWPSNAYWASNDQSLGRPVRRLQEWRRAGNGAEPGATLLLLELGDGFGRGSFNTVTTTFNEVRSWRVIIRGDILAWPGRGERSGGLCSGGLPNGSPCQVSVRFRLLAIVEGDQNRVVKEWDLATVSRPDRSVRNPSVL